MGMMNGFNFFLSLMMISPNGKQHQEDFCHPCQPPFYQPPLVFVHLPASKCFRLCEFDGKFSQMKSYTSLNQRGWERLNRAASRVKICIPLPWPAHGMRFACVWMSRAPAHAKQIETRPFYCYPWMLSQRLLLLLKPARFIELYSIASFPLSLMTASRNESRWPLQRGECVT